MELTGYSGEHGTQAAAGFDLHIPPCFLEPPSGAGHPLKPSEENTMRKRFGVIAVTALALTGCEDTVYDFSVCDELGRANGRLLNQLMSCSVAQERIKFFSASSCPTAIADYCSALDVAVLRDYMGCLEDVPECSTPDDRFVTAVNECAATASSRLFQQCLSRL